VGMSAERRLCWEGDDARASRGVEGARKVLVLLRFSRDVVVGALVTTTSSGSSPWTAPRSVPKLDDLHGRSEPRHSWLCFSNSVCVCSRWSSTAVSRLSHGATEQREVVLVGSNLIWQLVVVN
jgi:hypothetical protein